MITANKAAGTDNIPSRVLKDCAEELKNILTDVFNTLLSQAVVPTTNWPFSAKITIFPYM